MTEKERESIIKNETKRILDSNLVLNKDDKENLNNIIDDAHLALDNLKATENGTEEEKNIAFDVYKEKITSYGKTLSEVKYNFRLSKNEYDLMKNIIFKKLSYNRSDVFIGNLVRDEIFNNLPETFMNGKSEDVIIVDVNQATRLSYLVGKYEIVGINSSSDHFANLNTKFGEITRVYEYYKNAGDRIDNRFGDIMQGLEELEDNVEKVEMEPVTDSNE